MRDNHYLARLRFNAQREHVIGSTIIQISILGLALYRF